MTHGQYIRRRRNLVILVLSLTGLSQRTIADVLDLPRSLVGIVVRNLRDEFAAGKGRESSDLSQSDLSTWAIAEARKLRRDRAKRA